MLRSGGLQAPNLADVTRILAALVGAALLLTGCAGALSPAAGNDETDRVAQVVSDAISYPRQTSAIGYARSATGTTAAQDGRLQVVGVADLGSDDLDSPFGELVYRVHLEGSSAGLTTSPPATACYRAAFGTYGLMGGPDRVDCPDDAAPVSLPAPPTEGPQPEIPAGADRAVRRLLSHAPAAPDAAQVSADLVAALPAVGEAAPAEVDAAVSGTDVGVSVRGEGRCLLGARVAGTTRVWELSGVQLQPGELSCDPQTALGGQGDAPH